MSSAPGGGAGTGIDGPGSRPGPADGAPTVLGIPAIVSAPPAGVPGEQVLALTGVAGPIGSDATCPDATSGTGGTTPSAAVPDVPAVSADAGPVPPAAARIEMPVAAQPVAAAPGATAESQAPVRAGVAPLPQQLGAPAFALAQAAADTPGGTSTITVTVAPDDLGPITIRASISADGTRLEFFSTTDGGRDALRQALPDLRREASSSGLSASLDLGTGTPGDGRDGPRDDMPRHAPPGGEPPAPTPIPWTGRPAAGSPTLDLFA